jgi:hypothetical protein
MVATGVSGASEHASAEAGIEKELYRGDRRAMRRRRTGEISSPDERYFARPDCQRADPPGRTELTITTQALPHFAKPAVTLGGRICHHD